MGTIAAIFSFLAESLGFLRQRDAEKNTATMQAAAAARQEQSKVDASTAAVAQQDVKEIQQELAE